MQDRRATRRGAVMQHGTSASKNKAFSKSPRRQDLIDGHGEPGPHGNRGVARHVCGQGEGILMATTLSSCH
eukprot:NODE_6621_length_493_cov_366.500000.p4 GENE.NODE_6621_length_493_cov_366.500000~~NODE_6621_length_493_cov_366.500000.p4  ORF type:complete len:71 (-),score=3.68 NODE_6621_length_493_cov_366.500000:131-343(-)